jgi:hypothetical protein
MNIIELLGTRRNDTLHINLCSTYFLHGHDMDRGIYVEILQYKTSYNNEALRNMAFAMVST